jgi:hypothetical protein
MTQDLIRYDLLVQDALKGVVRKVLGDAAREGLPGEHHFYVSFRTDFPGVRLSTRMREKYPQDMTIVLQHQFWDLSVTEHALEVGLSFSGVPERLLIPFDALTGFFDPSVQFGLKFELQDPPALSGDAGDKSDNGVATLRPASGPAPARTLRGAGSEPDTAEPAAAVGESGEAAESGSAGETPDAPKKATKSTSKSKPAKKTAGKSADKADAEKADAGKADPDESAEEAPEDKTPGAEVVSLDAFRKKN